MKSRNEPSKTPAAGGHQAASGPSGGNLPPGATRRPCVGQAAAWLFGMGIVVAVLVACWPASHRSEAVADFKQGSAFEKQGRTAEAMACFERALKAKPDYADASESLGNLLVQSGRVTAALGHLQRAVELEPTNGTSHYNLGNALLQLGRVDEAIAQYQRDLALNPRDALAQGNLGNALLAQNRLDEALDHFSRAVTMMPRNAMAHADLGNALLLKGKLDQAVDQFENALEIQRDLLPAKSRLLTIAWIWATHPDQEFRNGILAVRLARDLDQLTGGKDPAVLGTLAAAYAEMETYDEAVKAGTQALRLATAQSNLALTAKLREQLDYYQSNRPYRDAGDTNQSPSR